MSKRFCSTLVVSILVRSIQLASSAEMPPLIERPNADSGPTEISVGMWFVDISSIDSAQQTFTAEIAVVLRWEDPRLAHTGNGAVRYPLDQIWHPRVGIVNETNSVSRRMPDSVEVEPDGTVTYRQRYVGAFTQPLRLQSFPFVFLTFNVGVLAAQV
jgi:Neurotransmitter-gated ion-channel ligand binding domain